MEGSNEYDKKRLRTFIRNVRQEILNLRAGESKFKNTAIQFPVSVSGDEAPVLQRLDALDNHPSQKSLDLFLMLATQDLSAQAGKAFTSWSDGIFAKEEAPVDAVQARTFELVVKDSFYDLFKAAQIPLNPKQVDLITVHSGKLAKAFQKEIHKTVKEQLKVLVTKLKTNDAPTKEIVKTGQNSASGYAD